MQILINIPEEVYKCLQREQRFPDGFDIEWLVIHGVPLPKGHGDLVDYRELKKNALEYGEYTSATLSHVKPVVLIEADKEK